MRKDNGDGRQRLCERKRQEWRVEKLDAWQGFATESVMCSWWHWRQTRLKGCWWACPGLKVPGAEMGKNSSLALELEDPESWFYTQNPGSSSEPSQNCKVLWSSGAGLNRTLQLFTNCWNWRDTRGCPSFKTAITLREKLWFPWSLRRLRCLRGHSAMMWCFTRPGVTGGLRGVAGPAEAPRGKLAVLAPALELLLFFSCVGLWQRWWILIPGIRETKMRLGIVFSWEDD